jgi:diketogulonate reductase-like aldo/keto reductase
LSWLGTESRVELADVVQRGHVVIAKSSQRSRIERNFQVFELCQSHFDAIEHIAIKGGQVRFGNWDDLWGSDLFAGEVL